MKNTFKDTIYALASGTQKCGVAVIRISGSESEGVARALGCGKLQPRVASLQKLKHPKTRSVIDNAIVIFYKGPNSFTGEDVLELHVHGSKAVVKIIMSVLSKMKNVRTADPGEFTLRSFMNGKMDLTQVEGLADLIDAETEAQHKQSIKQMSGALSDLYKSWRSSLIDAMSKIEALIDFPDDDVPESVLRDIENDVRSLKRKIESHIDDNKRGEKLREGVYVAIVGSTNAGKSSILNRLAGREAAITSHIAGTTRDVVEVHLNIRGYSVVVADTAGIRESNDLIEAEGIKRSKQKAEDADLKIVVVDVTDPSSFEVAQEFSAGNAIVVCNKIDLLKDNSEFTKDSLRISAKNNVGINELLDAIGKFVEDFFSKSLENPHITRQRYRDQLLDCCAAFDRFTLSKDLVMAAEDLRKAANSLGKIVGVIDPDAVLEKIFSSFCIGK